VTPLALRIGYDQAAALAKQALAERKTIRELVLERKLLTVADLDTVLDPHTLAGI
jgi:fumarate hydratase class II